MNAKISVFVIYVKVRVLTLLVEAIIYVLLYNFHDGTFKPKTLLKSRLRRRCFPVNFVKFFKTFFFAEHL